MKRIVYIMAAAALFANSSCKKGFLDINQNPNAATEESVTPQLLLPRVQHAAADRIGTGYDWTARWMGYWARSGTYGPSQTEESYNLSATFQQGQWAGWYDILFDANTMERKAAQLGGPYDYYQGIAKIYKAIGFQYLVDMYGNVPYTQAFNLKNNITPAYDKDQDIYNSLFVELDSAVAMIRRAENDETLLNLSVRDIAFKGNKASWLRLANTQRLKMVLRHSQVPGFNAAAQLAKVTAEGYIGAGQTAAVQPGYVASSSNPSQISQQNPFWETHKLAFNGTEPDQYNRANNYVLGLFRNNSDQRYTRVFSPVVTGCADCNPPVQAGSYFGFDFGLVNTDPNQPKAANSSAVSGPGLAVSASQPQWFFTSVESMFLQAEAAARGLITANAQAAYEAAVRESFVYLGLPSATADAYLASGAPIVDWAGSTNKVNLVMTQKYLALVGLNNFEPWADYRRTGVPAVPKSLAPSVGPNIPLRLLYPQTEINYNAANVAAQGNPNIFTQGIFWDR